MELAERRKRGQALTRPELAVLLAYAKLSLYDDLLEFERAGRSLSRARARALFPGQLIERYPDALEHHRLRREIIATQLTNSMINRGGPSLVGAHRRPDRRVRADDRGRVLRGARQLRHDRAQQRDRCARQQDFRQAAARPLRGGAGPAARPHGLVPAQRRPLEGARRRRRALSRRHRGGRGRARRRAAGRCARRRSRRATTS